MRPDLRLWPYVILCSLAALACDSEGASTNKPAAKTGLLGSCVAGDTDAGAQLVAELRERQLSAGASNYQAHRTTLREACNEGCGAACREYAHNTWDPVDAGAFDELACTHGEPQSCALDPGASPAASCERGDLRACAEASPEQVAQLSADACAANDGRSCSVHAWTRCTAGECDELAIEAASKAAQLVPEPEIDETLAVVYCHAGQPEQANASLAAACERGIEDACARTCEELRPARAVIVREARRATYEHIFTLIALQSNVGQGWYALLSAMNDEELSGFEDMLEHFTPELSEPGAAAKVPEAVNEQFPELVAAILRSPQLDKKKIKYWFSRLPEMTDEQRTNLMESLRNQWWVVPGDGRTPESYLEGVRLSNGGFGPS